MGTLYSGDNSDIFRRYLKDELADLVYLDPPFNSAQNYKACFQEKDGSAAPIGIYEPKTNNEGFPCLFRTARELVKGKRLERSATAGFNPVSIPPVPPTESPFAPPPLGDNHSNHIP